MQKPKYFWLCLLILTAAHVAVWFSAREVRARWTNVPPVSGEGAAVVMALGDKQFAYRSTGMMLQNLGNVGGRAESLKNYDYRRLRDWFLLTWDLDPRSNFVPYLAAFYFGAVEEPEKIRELVKYLEVAGQGSEGEKWRWMAHAVYLARFKLNDLDLAYRLAVRLAAIKDAALPAWAQQMPAFIMTAKGDKQAAYEIMINILKTSADKMPVQEVNFMRHYICDKLLTPEEAKANPLCKDVKW